MRKSAAILVLSALLGIQGGALRAQQSPPAMPPPQGGQVTADSSYQVTSGDLVSVTVFPADEYSREVTVQPDGKIELPLLGAVLVKGLTSQEISRLLENRYAHFVANPRITVNLRRYAGRKLAILGDVRSPGYYEFHDGMKLLELVSMAGGITDYAKAAKTRILRVGVDQPETVQVNLQAALDGKFDRNVRLLPNDIVFVPKGRFTQNAQWTNNNILPWLSVMTTISSIIILVHTTTGN